MDGRRGGERREEERLQIRYVYHVCPGVFKER